ncbi:MAG: AAA family ATPase [Bacteroidales bacterium]|nr:AAA family ATPase [Bacteroidales bacterium]
MNYIDFASQDEIFSSKVAEEQDVHNHEMNLVWRFVSSTNVSVFLTGKAGTGKTTFLCKLREMSPKRMVVLAPTGVAAINAQGQTIHSFFQLPFGPIVPGMKMGEDRSRYKMSKEKKNLIKTLDLLVIDEVSMVRCDVLDAIDQELRKYKDRNKPFGGVQLLLIGDLQQLAPVAQEREWSLLSPYYNTPYFFGSRALQQIQYVTIELKHIYRQQDVSFIDVLNRIRTNRMDASVLSALNARYQLDFEPPEDEDWIRLTTHNRMAQSYNSQKLEALKSEKMKFVAEVSGNFPENSYPADDELVLKKGAQVMFIKNDPTPAKEYYNGKIGVVKGMVWNEEDEKYRVVVHCKEDDKTIYVPQLEWENTKYVIDPVTKDIREEVEGVFKQYPLRLAWAITVHKSQGLTFDRAVLDITDSFTHGQVYVALSRCRTLEGMVLARPLSAGSVITDSSVNAYIDKELMEARQAEGKLPQMMYEYYYSLLNELFDYRLLKNEMEHFYKVVAQYLEDSYPVLHESLQKALPLVDKEIVDVSMRFQYQYATLMQQSDGNFSLDHRLQERLMAAMTYFGEKLHEHLDPVIALTKVAINNKKTNTLYNNALDAFTLRYKLKVGIIARLKEEGFSVRGYLRAKAQAALDEVEIDEEATKKARKRKAKDTQVEKTPKVDTKLQTFKLYREGKSMKEIAKERSLTEGTIASHLAYFMEKGEVKLSNVVSTQHQKIIQGIIRSFSGAYTITDVKNLLPADYSYAEIRLVIADMNKS